MQENAQAAERDRQEAQRRSEEAERRFQETERILREQNEETDRRFQEMSQEIEKMSQEIDRMSKRVDLVSQQLGKLGGKWGLFVENMVAPACETLFLHRGIPVHLVSQRVKKREGGDTLEIDILVTNNDHVLVVEVKSSLGLENIKELMEYLREFRHFFPEYSNKQLYGAVAGIEIEDGADRYAYRQGLFVLAQSGENVSILNDKQFQPRAW
ncbi:MAG: DUF3782 domain-containing protein [Microcystaceae cyanobacterium]